MRKINGLLISVAALVGWPCLCLAQYGAAAVNSASYDDTALAQGSLFVLFGSAMGPDKLVQAPSFPLPLTLAGTSVAVTSGATTLSCPMVYTSSGQVAAILPSTIPVGDAYIQLKYSGFGQTFYFPNINVVRSSPGIYALNSGGNGPGVFSALDGSIKSFTRSAKVGETLTLWATGLGPIKGNDAMPPVAGNIPGVEVFVGTQPAKLLYAGRSPCCAGLDQISFEVPQVSGGCFMPVSVRSGGIVSNFVTLPVDSQGGVCSDAGPGVPWSILTRALNGEQIKGGAVILGPIGILSAAGFNRYASVAAKLSEALHTPVSERDAERLINAWRKNRQSALRSAIWKYRKQWNQMDGAQKALLKEQANLTQEGALAVFGNYSGLRGLLPVLEGSYLPPVGTCTVARVYPHSNAKASSWLDAGPALALSGPAGLTSLTRSSNGRYQALFNASFIGPNLPPGAYTITGRGGKDVGPFTTTLHIGSNLVWSNKAAVASVDRSQPLTIFWSGGPVPGHVLIGGYQLGPGGASFFCTEDTSKGTFTVPALFLSTLHASSDHSAVVFIAPHPLDRQVSIPGLDLAYLVDASSDSRTLPVK